MTTPIKPPSSPAGANAPSAVDTAKEPARAEFHVDAASTPAAPTTRAPVDGLDGVLASVADELRAGRMRPDQAVDMMVRRVLDSPMASALSPSARARLESVVRAQLVDDPSLSALVADLGRGR